ncbi:MAG: autotransporter outer membrane beta-barrel domain-containing protein [Phascolarctobacterium sp.]
MLNHDCDGNIRIFAPKIAADDYMGGTWCKVAIGASRKVGKNNSFYIDIEKDFGNKVKKPYSIGAGYRYTW